MALGKDFEKNKKLVLSALKNNSDVKTREILIFGQTKAALIFLDGLAKSQNVVNFVLRPLTLLKEKPEGDAREALKNEICDCSAAEVSEVAEIVSGVMSGDTCLLVDGVASAIMCDTRGYNTRGIAEPPSNGSLRGPREGFIEDMKQNLIMLRRKIRCPEFKSDILTSGRRTQTNISVCYIDGVADPDVVKRVKNKIDAIDIDGVLDSSYVARFLEDRRGSLFPQVGRSEKPDAVASKLLEGRVAIIVDGSPLVLTVPFMIIEELHALDDYYEKPVVASIGRILRFLALAFALILPGLYVCLQKYNYQVMPVKFLMTVLNSTNNIPLSPLLEMLVVIFLFDMLQEANVRMPRTAGLALNVVGALVLGDAGIKAGLISAPAVLIGALNGIGLYAVPDELKLFSMLRWVFTLVAGLFGIFGMMLSVLFFVTYLNGMDSYGTPYLAPYAPRVKNDLQDGFLKTDLLRIKRRPDSIPHKDKIRLGKIEQSGGQEAADLE